MHVPSDFPGADSIPPEHFSVLWRFRGEKGRKEFLEVQQAAWSAHLKVAHMVGTPDDFMALFVTQAPPPDAPVDLYVVPPTFYAKAMQSLRDNVSGGETD